MNITVTLSEDEITVAANDVHPISYGDACQHLGDLALRLTRELQRAHTDGA